MRRPLYAGLLIPGALLLAGVASFNADILAGSGLRVARSNSSSENRSTLRAYGYYLLERRPIGYGLTFDSTEKWAVFYKQSIYMPNPSSIRNWALHNYYLNVLTKYGLLMLFLIPWMLPRRREQLILWMPFIPYMIHILYHNDGPLQGDTLAPGLFAAATLLLHRKELFRVEGPKTRPSPWRRAFADDQLRGARA